jgi:hypothetical protein
LARFIDSWATGRGTVQEKSGFLAKRRLHERTKVDYHLKLNFVASSELELEMVARFRFGLVSVALVLIALAGVGFAQGQPPQMPTPPRGSQPGMPPPSSMQLMDQWECKSCKHKWTTAANTATPTRCPSCKVTFTSVTNPDGTTSTTSQGWIKWIIGGIVLVFSVGGAIVRKILGNS